MTKTVKEAEESVGQCPETLFDQKEFELSIDLHTVGGGLRDELAGLTSLYSRINTLAAKALFMYEQEKNKLEAIETLAWEKAPDVSATKQKILIRTIPVEIDGDITTFNEQQKIVNIYDYIAKRGKSKMKEISDILDVGRSMLSWDKQEQSKY